MVDLNIRPLAIADADGLPRAARPAAAAHAHVVKASDDDLAWLDPDRERVDAARALLGGGPARRAAHARRRRA